MAQLGYLERNKYRKVEVAPSIVLGYHPVKDVMLLNLIASEGKT